MGIARVILNYYFTQTQVPSSQIGQVILAFSAADNARVIHNVPAFMRVLSGAISPRPTAGQKSEVRIM